MTFNSVEPYLTALRPNVFHVLVATAHTHGASDMKIVCKAPLAVGGDQRLLKEVLIAPVTFESLPTTFSVLNVARELMPMTVSEVDGELEAMLTDNEASDSDLAHDEDYVPIEGFDTGDSCDDIGL
jgi:hypothetical protein